MWITGCIFARIHGFAPPCNDTRPLGPGMEGGLAERL